MSHDKIHSAIALLGQLPESKESKQEFLQKLERMINKSVEFFSPCEELKSKLSKTKKITPKFVTLSLCIMRELYKLSNNDSPSSLISVQQQQKIKILLQMIFSLGLAPSLLKGVNISLRNKSSQLHLLKLEELTLTESYIMMSDVVYSLTEFLSAPNLRSLILTHLSDLMSALIQLVYTGEFKKPVKFDEDFKVPNENSENFVMTEEWYNRLINDRNEFKKIYEDLVNNIYKPLVIRELLILLAPSCNIENGETVPPPAWLKKAVSSQLTGYLTSPGGVSLVMRAICESTTDAVDWKKVETIAKLISTVHGNLSDDEFYSVISPQIISLLSTTGPYCVPVAKKCIKNIYEHNIEICNRYILNKLFEPFIICSKPVSENFNGTLVSEDSLSRCIDHLSKCFSPGSKNSSIPASVLFKIIKIIFELYMKVAKSAYQQKSAIQDLLVEFLHSEKDIEKLTIIYNALIFKEPHQEMLEMNEDLEFQFGPAGGVQVGKRLVNDILQSPGSEFDLEFEIAGDHMLDLLSHRQEYSKKLFTYLFVILLSSLSDFEENKIELPGSNLELLEVEELIMFLVKVSQKKVITIKMLADLSENVYVVESIQEKPEMVFKFIENLLETKAKELCREVRMSDAKIESDNESDDSKKDAEDLFVLLAVIDLMTVNVKASSDRWDMFKPLIKWLEIFKDNCPDGYQKYFSNVLLKRIATRGAVLGSKKPQSKFYNDFNVSESKNNIGIRSEQAKKSKKERPERSDKVSVEHEEKKLMEMEILMKDILSEDVPTRGHAIIRLSKLIKEKNPEVMARKDYIFTILKCYLKHEDTYIYLAAINALEALTSVQKADKILELLCEEYTENKKDSSELQMKIGEVLMKIVQGLGEVVPKYKSLLINTFLFGAKSTNEFLRVSSLSNLGELLKMLGYGVGTIIQEVVVCMESIALTDKSDMARRAAVMVVYLLLKGASKSTFIVLESVIRDLYRTLKHIYETDKDEVTKLHAELALSEINRLVKSSFNKTLKLEKHIGILDLLR